MLFKDFLWNWGGGDIQYFLVSKWHNLWISEQVT